jgi:hypothetical protein
MATLGIVAPLFGLFVRVAVGLALALLAAIR